MKPLIFITMTLITAFLLESGCGNCRLIDRTVIKNVSTPSFVLDQSLTFKNPKSFVYVSGLSLILQSNNIKQTNRQFIEIHGKRPKVRINKIVENLAPCFRELMVKKSA